MENETRPPEPAEPAIPPYEGRSTGGPSTDEQQGRADVQASSSGEPDNADQTASPADEQPAADQVQTRGSDPGVGPAHVTGAGRAEDIGNDDEAGRQDTGPRGASGRPSGESSGRDATSVDPQEDDG